MQPFIDTVLENFHAVDWGGPAAFVAIILAILFIFQRWSMFLIVVVTVVLGWGAQDFIIMNMGTDQQVVNLPFFIYCAGGGLLVLLLLIAFFKSSC